MWQAYCLAFMNADLMLAFQKNSKGFEDFCVRNIQQAAFGRREMEIAEQGQPSQAYCLLFLSAQFCFTVRLPVLVEGLCLWMSNSIYVLPVKSLEVEAFFASRWNCNLLY